MYDLDDIIVAKKLVLNDLSKKTLIVHNDKIMSLISSLSTFRVFLNKSFRIGFLLLLAYGVNITSKEFKKHLKSSKTQSNKYYKFIGITRNRSNRRYRRQIRCNRGDSI